MSNVFGGSHGATVQNSTFHVTTTYQATVSKGFNILAQAVARNAFHNSDHRHDPPKCHENTRVAIIQKIMDWVTGKIDTDAFMFWLFGPAGAGKSAIARTIAELCEAQKLLLASFFFFRTDSGRNTINPLIASIAYRIACVVPVARRLIETVIEEDPLILSCSLETQLKKLVLEPLHLLSEQGHFLQTPLPPLIIIDGVDECLDQDAQAKLIRLLSNSVAQYQLPLKFLLASRPEQHIKFAFAAVPKQLLSLLQLYDDFQSAVDMRQLLEDKFGDIKKHHPFREDIPASWPPEEQMDILVQKASGQFIYASLAADFINSPHHLPTRRLDVILNLRPPGNHDLPFAELDALYTSILSRARDPHLAIKVIGLGVALQEQAGVSFMEADVPPAIETVLDLEDGDVNTILSDLSSLLSLYVEPDGRLFTTRIHIHHSSFMDYLFSKERSGDYYLNIHESHALITKYILQTSTETNPDVVKSVTLASFDLLIHLRNSVPTPELEHQLEKFSLGGYLDAYAPVGQLGLCSVLDTMTEDVFYYLKETERNELYRHHSTLYLEHVMSSIESRPCPEKFHIMSAVWFVLQKPLKLCESKKEEVLEPLSSHLARLWRKFCGALCGFDRPDVNWDTYHYFLMRYPTSYDCIRASLEPLAGIYGGITETRRLVPEHTLSRRLVRVATSCIQSLRRRGSLKTSLHAWATKSKRSPWIWRWRTRATSTRRGEKVQDELHFLILEKFSPRRKPYSFPNSLRRSRQMLFSKGFQSEAFNWDARLSYMWALDLLRRTLRKARKSDELMEELSKPFIHWPAPILFPRRTRRVKKAIDAYLEKFGPPPSSLDIQADFRDTLAAESSFNEVEYASCESSDEDGYYSCPES